MKKGLLIGAAVAVLAIGGALYGYSWYCCATEAQAQTTVVKDDACCKAEEGKAQTASMSMGCCGEGEKKEAK